MEERERSRMYFREHLNVRPEVVCELKLPYLLSVGSKQFYDAEWAAEVDGDVKRRSFCAFEEGSRISFAFRDG